MSALQAWEQAARGGFSLSFTFQLQEVHLLSTDRLQPFSGRQSHCVRGTLHSFSLLLRTSCRPLTDFRSRRGWPQLLATWAGGLRHALGTLTAGCCPLHLEPLWSGPVCVLEHKLANLLTSRPLSLYGCLIATGPRWF